MMRIAAALLLTLSLSAEELPLLVRDLPGVETVDSFSNGTSIWTTIGNTTWFTAWTGPTTTDVFRTDGTNVVRVTFDADAELYIGSVGGKLVYGANDDVYAVDANGGRPVLLTGAEAFAPGVVLDGVLYFVADVGIETEMWRTDGTPAGTFKIDLLSGAQGAFNSALHEFRLFRMGDAIYFFGVTVYGTGLHRTLGTPQSTTMVTPLDGIGQIHDVYVAGDRLYFHAASRLWVTDGTSAGTAILMETFSFEPLAVFKGKLLFTTDRESIWSTDGTAAGTRETDIYSGTGSVESAEVLGDKLLFFVGEFGDTTRLFVTEGTGATTKAIAGVERGSGYGGFVLGDRYYFSNETAAHGAELWVTDGTTAQLFVDINPGPRSSLTTAQLTTPRPDGTVLFAAEHVDVGTEPWITDGTVAGTRLLANLAPDTRTFSSAPYFLRATGRRVFFTAKVTGDFGVGVSDGTSVGTTVTPITPDSSLPAVSNGRYFFTSNGQFSAFDGTTVTWLGHGPTTGYAVTGGVVFRGDDGDLWFSDGTPSGTRRILDLPSGTSVSLFSLGNEVWVDSGSQTWITNGTQAGTRELVLSSPRGQMNGVIRSGSRYFFFTNGSRLWRSDGTSAGTQFVKQTASGTFLGANAQYAYYETGGITGQLYRTDGTDAGTIALPLTSMRCAEMAFVGDVAIVRAVMPQGVQLWRSDGTVAGTTRLATFTPFEPCLFFQSDIEARGGVVYFNGFDAAHGWEPWVTDGTVAGTRMLVDLYPGRTGSEPGEFTLAEDILFFTATTPNIGNELWAIGARAAVPKRRAAGPR